ncbi:MAG: PSD1 and planctomycete cytochrome C domain-containing protein [Verrucomicrobiales bacterium]|nr:PSD1 and planctomycete cytochrome C domain-containing protein [Verrucomicrobiales bacterium]
MNGLSRRILVFLFTTSVIPMISGAKEIDFNRDIRPVLSDKCYKCHGPDAGSRKGDLRLDLREDALAAIQPGKPDESELLRRILHEDPGERMPPKKSHKTVSDREVKLLRQWISEGAEYAGHWSFQPIREPVVPADSDWTKNEIDRFIFNKLQEKAMKPSSPADCRTLLRRLTLDLTGLPPTPDEYVAFLSNPDIPAKIDELMASPRYGEHMAWRWLDAARYADSDGYESDPLRHMWPWRDWVVEAFNRHMPYDQFVIEQLAGDQLENPSMRQILATGFNRNHRLNNEGGVDPAEWLIEYVCDRAETTATVFMGLTWQCARCHDHKYDPISQKEYYQMFSFFHQLPEVGNGRGANKAPPMLEVSSLESLEAFALLREKLEPYEKELRSLQRGKDYKAALDIWIKSIEKDEVARQKLPGNLGKKTVAKWDAQLNKQADAWFLRNAYKPAVPVLKKMRPLAAEDRKYKATGAKVMVMGDMDTPRKSFILERGAFDQPGEEVSVGTPDWLPPMDEALPRNRLGLAKWLVDPAHPLTARVAVNREWQRFFGTGLVKTAEDFGAQGELPSHPELLDFLARRFIASGWNLQALQKLILTSATYQQSAVITPQALEIDPDNRLLARGPRYRLPAPVIRDQALAASGLLVEKTGGPPVKPYQPEGLWKEIIKGRVEYKRDTGEKLYRRSLYNLWRRAVKPPLMSLLDANGRDICAVDVKRTNTPLQALLLLNDETFVEHARGLATRMIREGGDSDEARLKIGLQWMLGRDPVAEETAVLLDEWQKQRYYFSSHPEAVAGFLSVGESRPDAGLDQIDLAATTAVARIILNLDETLTKE